MNILITGATSGIGRGLAEFYLEQGHKVAITGRRAEMLAAVKEKYPQTAHAFVHDVTVGGTAEIIALADGEMGPVDMIILNAGFGDINPPLDVEIELKTAKTNVCGFTDGAVAAYNYFKTRKAGILAGISSIASLRGGWSAPSYYASKAYVSSYLEGLRIRSFREQTGVTVCTIVPGFVETVLAEGVGGKGLFWVAPVGEAVKQIAAALAKKRPYTYITKRWRLMGWAMKLAPFWLYKRI